MSRNLRTAAAQLNPFPVNRRLGILGAGTTLVTSTSSPQVVNASVTPVVVPDLGLMLATGYWMIEINLNIAIANAAHNIRYLLTGPDGLVINGGASSPSVLRSFLQISGTADQQDPMTALSTTINGGTTSAWTAARVVGQVQVLSAGTLQLLFAQGVSGASNTQILGGSTMRATYISNNNGT